MYVFTVVVYIDICDSQGVAPGSCTVAMNIEINILLGSIQTIKKLFAMYWCSNNTVNYDVICMRKNLIINIAQ